MDESKARSDVCAKSSIASHIALEYLIEFKISVSCQCMLSGSV